MITEKLSRREKLELEIRQKQARLKDLDAQERVKERKRETRRKIIVGALMLQESANDNQIKALINKLINENVTSDNDRELFSLKPIDSFNQKGAE